MAIRNSYRQIFKGTTIFGGVQIINILVSVIKSKFVAILLGPTGMGIMGLLNSTIRLITGMTNFGLKVSAVKDVAASHATSDNIQISKTVTIVRRWVWITGLLGMVITIITAPLLSRLTFGNDNYTFSFIWISISLLFTQLSEGQKVLLQGTRKLKGLAKATLAGSILGLAFSIPLYYLFGLDGIVPAIIVTAIMTLIASWFFSHKIKIEKTTVSQTETFSQGKEMLKLGFAISMGGLITLGGSYIIRIFINNLGGLDQVGLYAAGFAIVTQYVGLIFSAMSTDYYPRLSAVAFDDNESKIVVNQQAEIAVLLLSPILTVFIVFVNYGIVLLYSAKFIPVKEMILWAAIGMFFKAASWCMGFLFLATGKSKMFFWNQIIYNTILLISSVLGYKYMGLKGLGLAFLITYFLYSGWMYILVNKKFNFSFTNTFYKIFGIQLMLAISCMVLALSLKNIYSYIIGSVIILLSVFYSYKELDGRLDIKSILKKIQKKI